MAKYKGIPIIDESYSVGDLFSTDHQRGYDSSLAGAFASVCPPADVVRLSRSELSDRIKRHETNESTPEHWAAKKGVAVLNQKSYGYCWCYGLVGAMQVAYAMTGGYTPHLNAFYPAYLGKNGRNQGGWAGEAIEYVQRYGVPHWGVFPDQPTNRALFDRGEVKASAALHKVVSFTELPRNDWMALASVLAGDNPAPVTLGLNWWGHLVHATKIVEIGSNTFGILIRNSWGTGWGENGLGILSESKSTAFEQIRVEIVSTVAA